MRTYGLVLITIGFLGGSLVSVLEPDTIEWLWFAPCAGLGVIGVFLVQLGIRRAATDHGRTQSNFQILTSSLSEVVEKLAQIDAEKTDIDVYELPERIDSTFRQDILAFADARESIAHACGMQSYAAVMSHFAAGERYLNRVWSCAADGYIDEAHAYITRSHEQFAEALGKLEALERRPI